MDRHNYWVAEGGSESELTNATVAVYQEFYKYDM